jgi:hypothetical protein
MRFDDAVVAIAAFLCHGEESAALHESQVLGRHVRRDVARFGKLAHGIGVGKQHLDNAEPMGVGEDAEALGRLLESGKREQLLNYVGIWRYVQ